MTQSEMEVAMTDNLKINSLFSSFQLRNLKVKAPMCNKDMLEGDLFSVL